MGVHSDVYICVRRDTPLDADGRATIVELALAHRLLGGRCTLAVPGAQELTPPPSLWQRVVALFRPAPAQMPGFQACALRAYGGLESGPAVHVLQVGDPGAWLVSGARANARVFAVSGTLPSWRGEPQDGGFAYLGSDRPLPVTVSDAYRRRDARRNPHVRSDGFVGDFYDVAVLSSRSAPDGRAVASSAFVKELKRRLGVKTTCRASFW